MQEELTPEQIASMSEVIGKYMGLNTFIPPYNRKLCSVFSSVLEIQYSKYHSSWDWIRQVWDKVKGELPITNNEIGIAAGAVLYGTKLEAFEALYNGIVFINQIKQQEDEKSV